MKNIFLFILLISFSTSIFSQVILSQEMKIKSGKIAAMEFSPDGKLIAVSSGNKIEVFLKQAESPIKVFKTPYYYTNQISFLSPAKLLISGRNFLGFSIKEFSVYDLDSNKYIYNKKFDNINGAIKKIFKYEDDEIGAGLIAGNQIILFLDEDTTQINVKEEIIDAEYNSSTEKLWIALNKKIIEYNLATKQIDRTIELKYRLVDFALSKNGKSLAYSDKKDNIYYTDESLQYILYKLNYKSGKKQYENLSFSWDGKYLASTNLFEFELWILENKSIMFKKKVKGRGALSSVKLDPSGKILAVAGYDDKKVELWNASALNISPIIDFKDKSDKTPPQVILTNPKIPKDRISVTVNEINLQGLVIDNMGIKEVKVNGQKAELSATGDFDIKINLAIGENYVVIESTDINNNTSIKKINIIRKEFNLEDLTLERKNHLLIISIDQYKYWPVLGNAVSDAENLANVLNKKYGFESTNIIEVKDSLATRQGVIDGFKNLITNVGPNDNVIIYFSGHGYFDATLGEGYWIPVDAKKGQDGDYLPNSFMIQLMKKVNCKHLFLVADACFSGSLFNSTNRGYTDNVGKYKSRWGLASGRLEYVSDGASGEHSPFNKYLVEYLEKNKKEEFSVSEIVQYVKINVANETNQSPIGNPLSGLGDEGGEFVFKIKNK